MSGLVVVTSIRAIFGRVSLQSTMVLMVLSTVLMGGIDIPNNGWASIYEQYFHSCRCL